MASLRSRLGRWLSGQGMLVVLLLVCAFFSLVTLTREQADGAAAGTALAADIRARYPQEVRVVVVAGTGREDAFFAEALDGALREGGAEVVGTAVGPPSVARAVLEKLPAPGTVPQVVAASRLAGRWALLENYARDSGSTIVVPSTRLWPSFLTARNLLNIANQTAVIAIIAIGMTMVIVTGGIDLSVGSLLALAAVVATLLIRDAAGAEEATPAAVVLCCLAAVALCGLIGAVSGMCVTAFELPAFMVTLATMLVVRGGAGMLAHGESIYQLPSGFVWLGREADLLNIPNAVVLMLLLYAVAHIVMTRTVLGRYLYAVGGSAEVAWLSGVPVRRVVILAYAITGLLAGLGGVITASLLRSGGPTYGEQYELYVIAGVVVGGTSIRGGEGNMFGTLVSVLLIAVIQNGMNLAGVGHYPQLVVLGAVLLGAVLLDRLRQRTSRLLLMGA